MKKNLNCSYRTIGKKLARLYFWLRTMLGGYRALNLSEKVEEDGQRSQGAFSSLSGRLFPLKSISRLLKIGGRGTHLTRGKAMSVAGPALSSTHPLAGSSARVRECSAYS